MNEQSQMHFIPATSGWWIVEPILSEKGESYDSLCRIPLIGWAVEVCELERNSDKEYFTARPVCIESLPDDWAIETPDGRFVIPYDRPFLTQFDLIESFNNSLSFRRSLAKE